MAFSIFLSLVSRKCHKLSSECTTKNFNINLIMGLISRISSTQTFVSRNSLKERSALLCIKVCISRRSPLFMSPTSKLTSSFLAFLLLLFSFKLSTPREQVFKKNQHQYITKFGYSIWYLKQELQNIADFQNQDDYDNKHVTVFHFY